jgi:stress-induced morphogen
MTPKEIYERLTQAYPDGQIEVFDMTGTEDHYQVEITSLFFANISRIQAQRAVMDVFSQELKSGEVHALTIKTRAPSGA